MKNKAGFVFVETLIVVAVLTFSLLMIYSSYNSIVISERVRLRHNDSVYLYRTYYLEKFFQNFRIDTLKVSLSDNNSIVTNFGCSNTSIFMNEEENIGFCEEIVDDLHVNNLYFATYDLSALQNCQNNSGVCMILNEVNEDMAAYLKTIGEAKKSGYRLIVEYAENKDGTKCVDNNKCQYYYATINLGEL